MKGVVKEAMTITTLTVDYFLLFNITKGDIIQQVEYCLKLNALLRKHGFPNCAVDSGRDINHTTLLIHIAHSEENIERMYDVLESIWLDHQPNYCDTCEAKEAGDCICNDVDLYLKS